MIFFMVGEAYQDGFSKNAVSWVRVLARVFWRGILVATNEMRDASGGADLSRDGATYVRRGNSMLTKQPKGSYGRQAF